MEQTPDNNYHRVFGYTFLAVHSAALPLSLGIVFISVYSYTFVWAVPVKWKGITW